MHRDGRSRCESCWRQAGKNDVHLLPEELDEKVAKFHIPDVLQGLDQRCLLVCCSRSRPLTS